MSTDSTAPWNRTAGVAAPAGLIAAVCPELRDVARDARSSVLQGDDAAHFHVTVSGEQGGKLFVSPRSGAFLHFSFNHLEPAHTYKCTQQR